MTDFPKIPGCKIERKIGENSTADVFLGIQEDLDRKVAIKVLAPEFFHDKTFADRFLKESQMTASFIHPNIVDILEAGESGGSYYIVMEYLPECLGDKINRQFAFEILDNTTQLDSKIPQNHKKLDDRETLRIIRQVARALDYAHNEGVIHKDITPQSIRFREDGAPVITGFFLSKLIDSTEAMKKKGFIFTSPHYVSPEQALRKILDPASDIYSLGVVFYEMLTGGVPYHADEDIAIENQHVIEPVPELPDSLSHFQDLLDRMMAKNLEERISNAAELIEIIDRLNSKLPGGRSKSRIQHDIPRGISIDIPPDIPKSISMNTISLPDEDETDEDILKEILEEVSTENQAESKKEAKKRKLLRPKRFEFNLNPSILFPLIGIAVLLVVLFVIFKPFSHSPVDKVNDGIQTRDTASSQKISPEDEEKFQYKFQLAQAFFNKGKFQIALDKLKEAEKIKQTPESKQLGEKIIPKLADSKDHDAFNKAVAAGTPEALEDYLKLFPSGLHIKEVEEKSIAIKETAKKQEEEKRRKLANSIKLRSQYTDLTTNDVKAMLVKFGFFDKYYNKDGNFKNKFELKDIDKEKIVLDYATGLTWCQNGSREPINFKKALKWIDELNQKGYGGYSDWRLPTLEELESLIESVESRDGLFIDSIFSPEQRYIWTGDTSNKTKGWAIDFFSGDVDKAELRSSVYVRPVRSM